MSEKKSLNANIEALFLAIIWGATMVSSKFALETFSPTFMVAFRYITAGIIVGLVYKRHIIKVDRLTIIYGLITGVSIFAGMEIQLWGLQNTEASHQSFILTTYTVIVPILEWFITKKAPGFRVFIAVPLIMAGVALISLNGQMSMNKGDAITLLFAFVYSIQIILIGIFVKNCDRFAFNFYMLICTGILAAIGSIIFGINPLIGVINTKSTLGLLYLTIFATFFAFVLQVSVQSKKTSTSAVILMSLESVFGMIAAFLILKEPIGLKMIIGGALIVFANILVVTKKDDGGKNEELQNNH